jgi:hypothetical protein
MIFGIVLEGLPGPSDSETVDAVATQDTVTQLITAIRRVRSGGGPVMHAHDYDDAGKPVIA